MLGVIAVALLGGSGCKSKKKAAEAAAAAEEKARIEREMEEKRRAEAEEAARRKAEEDRLAAERARAAAAENSPEKRLEKYFDAIASGTGSDSRNMQEAMSLFASPETPVLIVISEEGGQKDYDRPTTIKEYLNYLKDTKNNVNRIFEVKYDAAGKITELELIKEL
jgi:hypothetical protein